MLKENPTRTVGLDFVDLSSDAHSGNQALHTKLAKGQHLYVGQSGTIIPGQTYEVSVWVKKLSEEGTAVMHFLFSGKKAGVAQTYARPKATVSSDANAGWVQTTVRFVAPEHATSLSPQVRFTGPAEFLMDDYKMVCVTNEMPKPSMPDKLPAIKSLITEDPGFESGTVGAEIHTIPQWDETIGDARISDQYAHTGTKSEAYLDYHPEDAGFKIIQLISPAGSRSFKERMDKAYEQGLLCLINLYYLGACTGSDNMIENTIKVVNEVKDHPALFDYKIQDEPYQKGNTDEEMMRAYELVRNLDPHHPVYSCDSVTGGLEWLFRYCDIMDTAYFHGANADAGRKTSDAMDIAMRASKGRKPFNVTMQAFPMGGYLPKPQEPKLPLS